MTTQETRLERPCPSCGEAVELEAADLVAGMRVRCMHCNTEALVEQAWDAKLGIHHWTLEEADDELPGDRT